MNTPIAVVKFGSSILQNESGVSQAVHEVYQYIQKNYKVLVIVSAMGETTDVLLDSINKLNIHPTNQFEEILYADFLATGEQASTNLFTLALLEAGISATKIPHDLLTTNANILDAMPIALNCEKIYELFKNIQVIVMPGFLGTTLDKTTTLLGRGGSDFSAIFVAYSLNAEACVLYKDTPGILTADPKDNANAEIYKQLSFEDCIQLSYPVVQTKAVQFAQEKNYSFSVKTLTNTYITQIGKVTSLYESKIVKKPLKIILLGLGTVGMGVYQRLSQSPDKFEICGIGVKHLEKHPNIPKNLLSKNILGLLERDADVVIELIGEPLAAEACIKKSLQQKKHVITANKNLIAMLGLELEALATANNVKLLYSSSVGGSLPILEILKHLQHKSKKVRSITGILNGTCNYVLEKMAQGVDFAAAIKSAQLAGFAEQDPTFDITGLDTAFKLKILAKHAFSTTLNDFPVEGIASIQTTEGRIKLIAHCAWHNNELHAYVKPLVVDHPSFFTNICGAENGILIELMDGDIIQLRGKGAGRYPTAESVVSDLIHLYLENSQIEIENAGVFLERRYAL
jgi:homoserine dehydrogenase